MTDPKPKTIVEIKSIAGASLYRWEGYSQRAYRSALEEAVESGAVLSGADLSGAVLRGADLSGAVLSGADLIGANLHGADLRDSVLSGADLSGADLIGADLSGAVLSGANLRGADLSGAVLSGAVLRGAVLRGADLRDADLSGADLSGADLSDVRSDVYDVLARAPHEVPGLLAALREGRVDGTTYTGPCACLVGTLANVRGVDHTLLGDLRPNADRPAERWFLAIREGDTPATSQVSAITAEWIEAWIRGAREGGLVTESITGDLQNKSA